MSISPFAERGLNEALGLAIGFWSIETSEAMLEVEASDDRGESSGAVSRTVVGVEALDADAKVGEKGESEMEESDDAASGLVWEDRGKGEARVVVDAMWRYSQPAPREWSRWRLPVTRWPGRTMRASFLMSKWRRSPGAARS